MVASDLDLNHSVWFIRVFPGITIIDVINNIIGNYPSIYRTSILVNVEDLAHITDIVPIGLQSFSHAHNVILVFSRQSETDDFYM